MFKSLLARKRGIRARSGEAKEMKEKHEEGLVVKESVLNKKDKDLLKRLRDVLPEGHLADLATLATQYNAVLRSFDIQNRAFTEKHEALSEELGTAKAELATQKQAYDSEVKTLKEELARTQAEQKGKDEALVRTQSQVRDLQKQLETSQKKLVTKEKGIEKLKAKITEQVEKITTLNGQISAQEKASDERVERVRKQVATTDQKFQEEHRIVLTLKRENKNKEDENKTLKESLQAAQSHEGAPPEGISYADYHDAAGEVLVDTTGTTALTSDDENEADEGMPFKRKRHSQGSAKDGKEVGQESALTLNELRSLEAAKREGVAKREGREAREASAAGKGVGSPQAAPLVWSSRLRTSAALPSALDKNGPSSDRNGPSSGVADEHGSSKRPSKKRKAFDSVASSENEATPSEHPNTRSRKPSSKRLRD